jgi:hypothetical protein
MNEEKRTIRVRRLTDRGPDRDLANTTASERMGMMWQLALDAWAFMGEDHAESRLQRHVVRLIRRKR